MNKNHEHIFNNNLEFRFPTDYTLSNWLAAFFLSAAAALGYGIGKPGYGIGIGSMLGVAVYYKYLQRKTVLFLVNDEIRIIYNDNCLIINPSEILRIENKNTEDKELMKFFFTNPQISAFEINSTFSAFRELKENILNSYLNEKLVTAETCPLIKTEDDSA
jgi:hypothetical protein